MVLPTFGPQASVSPCLDSDSSFVARSPTNAVVYSLQISLTANMRLLNARTRKLKEFMGHNNAPPYAILSHTWGKDEVTCHDIDTWDFKWKKKEGYFKIKNCCEQAILDGLDWVWVDT